MPSYDHKKIEEKWQRRWREQKLFQTPTLPHSAKPTSPRLRGSRASRGRKMYVLDMFPYPSGSALHVGHPKGYIATDIFARYHRMKGYSVLHPMGWDAFGLPAENYAIKNKVHPRVAVEENIKRFKQQLDIIGFDYDWSREIDTTDPGYYKWTQWIFLQLLKKGLAYESYEPINWCPSCKTGLANEDIEDGKCEQCGTQVELKRLRQWVLKITAYADKMLAGLKDLDWPESIKISQENWIGKSEGAEIVFEVAGTKESITVFTTRPDTIFGATYMVVAPEHPLVERLKGSVQNYGEVQKYIEQAKHKTELQRKTEEKEKTGVELKGVTAVNPATGEKIPVWVADYVLMGYGTGSIMAVPAHDKRDFAFAKKFNLRIVKVVLPESLAIISRNAEDVAAGASSVIRVEAECWTGPGQLINSAEFTGMNSDEAKRKITVWLEKAGKGKAAVTYKMKDWVFSRQRYWGEPIPVVHCEKCGAVPVPEEDLPVELPEVDHYEPTGTGESPLANIAEWVNVECPNCGHAGKRETNTMPQWAGSSWYYLRYIDPKNAKALVDKKKEKAWMPVDMYVGGAEHATRHLIYARFWHRFLYDEGHVSTPEPFARLQNVGLIAGEDGRKMSKRWGNVVNPDDMVEKYGADALRLMEMFLGPFNQGAAWSTAGVAGTYRFLKRLWSVFDKMTAGDAPGAPRPTHRSAAEERRVGVQAKAGPALNLKLHQTIRRVTESTANFRFNVAVAAFMEFLNELEKQEEVSKETLETFVLLLSPYAPHIAEELWEKLGHEKSLTHEAWPEADEKILESAQVTIPVQVNGRVRALLTVEPGFDQAHVEELAHADQNVSKYLTQGEVKKVVYVPDKLLNFVVK